MADTYSFQYYPGCRENNIQILHALVTSSWTQPLLLQLCWPHGLRCLLHCIQMLCGSEHSSHLQLGRHALSQIKWLHSFPRKLRTWPLPRQVFIILLTWTEAPTFCFYCPSTTRVLSRLSSKVLSSLSLQLKVPRNNCRLLELKWHQAISICQKL